MFGLVAVIHAIIGAVHYSQPQLTMGVSQSEPSKIQDTYYVVSHFHHAYSLVIVMAFYAALTWLQTRLGALFYPRLTKILFWLLHIGLVATTASTLVVLWTVLVPGAFTNEPVLRAKLDVVAILDFVSPFAATLSLIAAFALLLQFLWSLIRRWREHR